MRPATFFGSAVCSPPSSLLHKVPLPHDLVGHDRVHIPSSWSPTPHAPRRCEALASFYEPRAGLSFGKTSTLPALMREKRSRLEDLHAVARYHQSSQFYLSICIH